MKPSFDCQNHHNVFLDLIGMMGPEPAREDKRKHSVDDPSKASKRIQKTRSKKYNKRTPPTPAAEPKPKNQRGRPRKIALPSDRTVS